jgi:FemAB-related protein (PEP-CTERM system-associated)
VNAFAPVAGLAVRHANLDCPDERRRILAYVRAQPDAQPFHLPQWSEAVERGCRQRSHYLVAGDEAVEGVLPLTEIRSPLFGSALVSTGFGVGGGILAEGVAAADALADAAWALAVELGCPSLELRGGRLPDGWTRQQGVYADFSRDLPDSDEAILLSVRRKERAEVRRAQGHGLTVSIGSGASDLDAHYRVYAESVRNLGTPVFPRSLFAAALEAFGEDADIVTISRDGRPLASVLSLYFRGTAFPYWGGGTWEARKARANDLLYYEAMCHARRRGCTRFDIGRSKLGTGAYAFKKNWGFEPRPLVYASRTADGAAPREINPLDPRYRLQVAVWKRLPLWVANRLGPLIARGLG